MFINEYGEEETYPQTVFREFKGLAHTELVMMFPERFVREVRRFLEEAK